MITRRRWITSAVAAIPAAGLLGCAGTPTRQGAKGFTGELGINIYSLRYKAKEDLPGTLELIRDLGFRHVEAGDLYGRSPAEFQALLKANGLQAKSVGASYKALGNEIDKVIEHAKTLESDYVVCSTIPHSEKHLAVKDLQPAADNLNRWGETLAASKLRLCYHTHGTEFDPSPDGTRFDTLAKMTDPKFVNYEMDIFWIVYGLQDPVDFLERYPGRFPLMHVKDIRKGTVLNLTPADVAEDDSVPLGTGLVDVGAALLAAQRTGVQYMFLEEEAVDALPQIRESLRYIEGIR